MKVWNWTTRTALKALHKDRQCVSSENMPKFCCCGSGSLMILQSNRELGLLSAESLAQRNCFVSLLLPAQVVVGRPHRAGCNQIAGLAGVGRAPRAPSREATALGSDIKLEC